MPRLHLLFTHLCCLISLNYSLPAFIGAQGWGADTPGGRGGRVIQVTTLASSGPGSFMEALQTKGPRIIVFRVSGVINLVPPGEYFEPDGDYSYVTIAGQTSPGGVTLTGMMNPGGSIWWCYSECRENNFHDGIFRFLRFRGTSDNEDAITLTNSHDFIFDHCDFSGGADETQDLTYNHHFTIQWCTIANSSKGQTYGSLIAYPPTTHISLHHNVWAHHLGRGGPHMHWSDMNPSAGGLIDYRNNVCYDANDFLYWSSFKGDLLVNFKGNYFKAGPGTTEDIGRPVYLASGTPRPYLADNIWVNQKGEKITLESGIFGSSLINSGQVVDDPHVMPDVSTLEVEKAYVKVLDWVGAFPRDAMNKRTVYDIHNTTGVMQKDDDSLIQSGPEPPPDTDSDGMPDFWEEALGFNPSNATDNTEDHDNDGYTNIEEYLNDLALARVCEDYYNPVYPLPITWPDFDTSCCKYVQTPLIKPPHGFGSTMINHGILTCRQNKIRITLAQPDQPISGIIQIVTLKGQVLYSSPAKQTIVWNSEKFTRGVYLVQWLHSSGRKWQQRLLLP